MTVQHQARARLAALRGRRAANAEAPQEPSWRLQRQEVELLQRMPLDKLRGLVEGQFRAAQEAWRDATKVPWYYGLTTLGVITDGAGRFRYGPELELLNQAKEQLDQAAKETKEEDARRALIGALSAARIAAGSIAEEAKLGSTAYLFWVKPSVDVLRGLLPSLPDGWETVLLALGGLWLLSSRERGRRADA